MAQFALRWAQLDLARQMEPLDYMEKLLELFSRAGYNGVLLYLEDRIATPSYDLSAKNECYSMDEIRRLVKCAEKLNMELVPCVATLGHAERFLRHKELQKMAELRDGIQGRFGGDFKQTFCISHAEFYDFIGRYLTEVASLFPSKYFHIGLDEFWDYNLCPDCRKKMPTLAEEERYFLEHICKIREILKKSGKEVMMWSDMFEHYSEIYKDVPKDVIMVDWQYQQEVRNYQGHLMDVAVEDRIKVNAANGFRTIAAPADMILNNSQSYFEYADGRENVIGGLLTSWEKSDTFLYRSLPVFLAAGFQMNGMEREEAFAAAMKLLTGSEDPAFISLVKTALHAGWFRHFDGTKAARLLSFDFYGTDPVERSTAETLLLLLRAYEGKFTNEFAARFMEDLLLALEEKCVCLRGRDIVRDILEKGEDKDLAAFTAFRKDYSAYLDKMEKIWEKYRPGITPNVFTEARKEVEGSLLKMEKDLASKCWINVSFCLPDYYGIERLTVEYKCNGSWHTAGSGVYKTATQAALFSRFLLIDPAEKAPMEALRFTASGMGGVGVTFVECNMAGRRYVPANIADVTGDVKEPWHILRNDTCFAWFGGQQTRSDYFDAAAAAQKHTVLLNMKEFSAKDLVFVAED